MGAQTNQSLGISERKLLEVRTSVLHKTNCSIDKNIAIPFQQASELAAIYSDGKVIMFLVQDQLQAIQIRLVTYSESID